VLILTDQTSIVRRPLPNLSLPLPKPCQALAQTGRDASYRRDIERGGDRKMKKAHIVAIALLLGLAAMLGVLAASRTVGVVGVGASSRAQATTSSVTARVRRLNKVELALRRALRDRPPALPRVPASTHGVVAAPRVVYRRPAPIVVIKHSAHHDDSGGEREAQGGGDD
jgi:hypothetical protein